MAHGADLFAVARTGKEPYKTTITLAAMRKAVPEAMKFQGGSRNPTVGRFVPIVRGEDGDPSRVRSSLLYDEMVEISQVNPSGISIDV